MDELINTDFQPQQEGTEMKKNVIFIIGIVFFVFASLVVVSAQNKYIVNLNDQTDDQFKITLYPDHLSQENNIYQFAVSAPGTYEKMDIGRFVRSFTAYDKDGNIVPSEQSSLDQWTISDPQKVFKIEYKMADIWDTPVDSEYVYPMCSSSLEKDNAYMNGQCLFGYFHGMQSYPMEIKLEMPSDWIVGTALDKDSAGYYYAPTFDYVVDSPILAGKLTKASANIEGSDVEFYTYSKTGVVTSEQIMNVLEDILSAESEFLKGLPVKRYVFLYHFENMDAGAWEHSYSSGYVYKERPMDDNLAQNIKSVAAHEFFHIVTPLHIHSELIDKFNFEKPVMSQHLWLYEGVTEWAAHIIQLRDYLITPDQYLKTITKELNVNDEMNPNISLTELGVNSFKLHDQYYNIYNKGAVIGTLLDIRLLELSGGKKGLRELLLELMKKYGTSKPISEKHFFDTLVAMTYPQIGDFIDKYIKGTEKLPIEEYFNKIGIGYKEFAGYDSTKTTAGLNLGLSGQNLVVKGVMGPSEEAGIKPGDLLLTMDGQEISLKTAMMLFGKLRSLKPGDELKLTIQRGDEKIDKILHVAASRIRNQFTILENPTPEQLALRKAWMTNL